MGVQRINVCSPDPSEAETQYVLALFMACGPRTYSNKTFPSLPVSRDRIASGTKTTTNIYRGSVVTRGLCYVTIAGAAAFICL